MSRILTYFRPNDLAAIGPDQFIFTNDGVTQSEMGNLAEILSGYKGGSVYYWDGEVVAWLHITYMINPLVLLPFWPSMFLF